VASAITADSEDPPNINVFTGNTAADTDGNEFKVGVNGGYDFSFDNITVGPRLGLHYKHTRIDGYRERGNSGLELVYASQTENSLTGVLGMYGSIAISTAFGVLVPQTTIEYVHEFKDDQRRIKFHFADDLNRNRFRFENDPPDRNYFNLGVGIVAVLPHGFSPFINYRALVGYNEQSSHAVTAGLRVEF
jgi:outer membrane autotransporter protein